MDIAKNIADITRTIGKAAQASGRHPTSVSLVVASKGQSPEAIRTALAAGHRVFGENRVQEAQRHWPDLKVHYPDCQLHLIGPLQTNKVRSAVALFDVIQTIDRANLARELSVEMKKQDRHLPSFIQINTGEEGQKAGVVPAGLADLLALCRSLALNITGLMCIPPASEPPALHFALLAKLANCHGLKDLSMGMSSDFEKAIPLGATYVRIGTRVFCQDNGQLYRPGTQSLHRSDEME